MNVKQVLFTGVAGAAIVACVALMPVSAEVKAPKQPAARATGAIVQSASAAKRPASQEQVGDLTYN